MQKRSGKKIGLNRETLRNLSSGDVRQAVGAVSVQFTDCDHTYCATCSACSACPGTCYC